MKKQILTVTLLSLSALFAQEPGATMIAPYPVPFDQLKQYLTLTDPQVTALEQIRQSRLEQERTIYQQISEKQRQMWALLEQGSSDALAVGRLMVDINNLQKQLPLRGDTYRTEVLAQLTPPQKAKLPALTEALKLQSAAWQATELNMIDNPVVPDGRGLPVPLHSTSATEPIPGNKALRLLR